MRYFVWKGDGSSPSQPGTRHCGASSDFRRRLVPWQGRCARQQCGRAAAGEGGGCHPVCEELLCGNDGTSDSSSSLRQCHAAAPPGSTSRHVACKLPMQQQRLAAAQLAHSEAGQRAYQDRGQRRRPRLASGGLHSSPRFCLVQLICTTARREGVESGMPVQPPAPGHRANDRHLPAPVAAAPAPSLLPSPAAHRAEPDARSEHSSFACCAAAPQGSARRPSAARVLLSWSPPSTPAGRILRRWSAILNPPWPLPGAPHVAGRVGHPHFAACCAQATLKRLLL